MSKEHFFNKWITAVLLFIQDLCSYFYVIKIQVIPLFIMRYTQITSKSQFQTLCNLHSSSIISTHSWRSYWPHELLAPIGLAQWMNHCFSMDLDVKHNLASISPISKINYYTSKRDTRNISRNINNPFKIQASPLPTYLNVKPPAYWTFPLTSPSPHSPVAPRLTLLF